MDFSSFSSAWQFFDTNSLPNFLRSPRVFLKSRMVNSLIFLLKSTTLSRKWFVQSFNWTAVLVNLIQSPFPFWHWNCHFELPLTYALGFSFIKSSLLGEIFIVCCQLNNIKQHAWWIKKKYFKERKVSTLWWIFFVKAVNGYREYYKPKLRSVTDSGTREFGIPNSQIQNIYIYDTNK